MANLASLTSFKDGDRRKVIRNGSRFEHWKKIFLAGFNSMFIVNLIGLLGLMPVILSAYYYIDAIWNTASILPFASTLGTAILPVVDTASIQHITTQAEYSVYLLMLMPIAIVASSVLISPFLYAIRNAEYDGMVTSYTNAIKGFKYNGVRFGILGVIFAVLYEIIAVLYYLYSGYTFTNGTSFISVLMLVGIACLACVFFVVMVHVYILSVTYKMSLIGAIKRSLIFTFTLPLQNIFVLIATLLPLVLVFFGSFMVSLAITLYLFVGLSYMASIWMVYVQTVLTVSTPQYAKQGKK